MGYNHNVSLKDPPIETLGALTGPLADIRPLDHSGSRTCLSKCDFGDDRILLYHRPTFDTESISGGCIVLNDCTATVSTGRLMRLGIRKDFNWRWDEELTITKSLKRRGCRSCVIGSRLLVRRDELKKETVWRDLCQKFRVWHGTMLAWSYQMDGFNPRFFVIPSDNSWSYGQCWVRGSFKTKK